MNANLLLERFQQYFGHTNFRDASYAENEHNYKFDRGREMHEWLGQEMLRQLVEQEEWAQVCERTVRPFDMDGGLALAVLDWRIYSAPNRTDS